MRPTSSTQRAMAVSPSPSSRPASPTITVTSPTPTVPLASVSTAFPPTADRGPAPDTVLISSDDVQFYISAAALLPRFSSLLPASGPPIAGVPSARAPDAAETLNIVLHVAHGRSPAAFSPSVAALAGAADRLPAYGLDARAALAPGQPLHTLLAAQAPLAPMAVYVAAARADAYALAATASAYLLSYPLYTVTDELAEEMGAVYLGRLFMLHRRRLDALKGYLAQAPEQHPERPGCGFAEQATLTKNWLYTTACIMIEAQPDTSAGAIETTLYTLMPQLKCSLCKASLKARIERLAVEWSLLGVGIQPPVRKRHAQSIPRSEQSDPRQLRPLVYLGPGHK
ncbi:hypothetical protein HDZ31DRAFT_39435 [Schizophyllum fasciatum]